MQVSAVIPTYGRPEDLSKLLNSLLRQAVKPLEIIVVDDKTPTDVIKVVCDEYKAKCQRANINLIYIKNPRKRSAAVARNVGTEKARGEFILFLDSDIILYPDFIEKILDVFKQNAHAIGVQGWIVNRRKAKFYYFLQTFCKMFFLNHDTKDSCRFMEYPNALTKVINCEWSSGGTVTFKRNIFSEFQFDENLTDYSHMEDDLFSHSIFQKYPNSLFMTPYAKCIHTVSEKGRMESRELKEHKRKCRRYVLTKLFGFRGLLLYYWQNIGFLVFEGIRSIKNIRRG